MDLSTVAEISHLVPLARPARCCLHARLCTHGRTGTGLGIHPAAVRRRLGDWSAASPRNQPGCLGRNEHTHGAIAAGKVSKRGRTCVESRRIARSCHGCGKCGNLGRICRTQATFRLETGENAVGTRGKDSSRSDRHEGSDHLVHSADRAADQRNGVRGPCRRRAQVVWRQFRDPDPEGSGAAKGPD